MSEKQSLLTQEVYRSVVGALCKCPHGILLPCSQDVHVGGVPTINLLLPHSGWWVRAHVPMHTSDELNPDHTSSLREASRTHPRARSIKTKHRKLAWSQAQAQGGCLSMPSLLPLLSLEVGQVTSSGSRIPWGDRRAASTALSPPITRVPLAFCSHNLQLPS